MAKTLSVKVPEELHRAVMAVPEERRIQLLRLAAEAIARHGEREGMVKAISRFVTALGVSEIDVKVEDYYVTVLTSREGTTVRVKIYVYREGRMFNATTSINNGNVEIGNMEIKNMDVEEALEAVLKAVAWRQQ